MDVRSQVPVQTALALTVLLAWPGLAQAAPGPLHAGPLLSDAPVQAPTPPPRRPISLDEAVALALEQNLEIRVERLNPQIQDLGVAQARTAWAPALSSFLRTTTQNSPPASALAGGQVRVTDEIVAGDVVLDHRLPWGGAYSVSWDSSRLSTNNIFTNFDPVLRSNLSVGFVQPFARNFAIDAPRQQLLVIRKDREMSDVQLRQTVVRTIRSVKYAYWDLVYALDSLAVQQQSLDLAREMLRNHRAQVEIGTMAPIDIVEAEAEVARNEEAVIVAEGAIARAEDALRALILDPAALDFWRVGLEPTDTPRLEPGAIDIEAALNNALDVRTDLGQARTRLEASNINIRYYRNQTLPEVNLQVNYSLAGLGGTQLIRGPGFPGEIVDTSRRGFGAVLGDIAANDFPTWTVGVVVGYPLGTSTADANLARARLQHSQSQLQIRNLELQVTTEVRDVGRQVQTNLKRVDATRTFRTVAERRLEAEQKKFEVGMSTTFQVFQAQRDLAEARNAELRALLDYTRSLADFEAVQETGLAGAAPGSLTLATTAAPAGGTAAGAGGAGAGPQLR